MESTRRTATSKRLAWLLRHAPQEAGPTLDKEGWAPVPAVLGALGIERADLEELVRLDAKGRYQLDADRIRAVQGHSTTQVDRDFPEREPPELLFHGTNSRALRAIMKDGLQPMSRQYVHLSPDEATARAVGSRRLDRRAKLVVLRVAAGQMSRDGAPFYLAENGVWLVEKVEPRYLEVLAAR